MNLAVNARDAMPRGGTLDDRDRRRGAATTDTRRSHRRCPAGRYVHAGGERHRAAGWTPRRWRRIFEPFFTTKGLGQGHRARARDGVRHRQAERRLHLGHQRGGPGHHLQDLPAARWTSAEAEVAAAPPPHRRRTRPGGSCWSKTTRRAGADAPSSGGRGATRCSSRGKAGRGARLGGGPSEPRRPAGHGRRHARPRRKRSRPSPRRAAAGPARSLRVGLRRRRPHAPGRDRPRETLPLEALLRGLAPEERGRGPRLATVWKSLALRGWRRDTL